MANTGIITVTPEQLSAQSGTVRTKLGEMQNRFDELKTLLSGTSEYWVGEAGDAHRQSYMARIGKIEEMFRRYQEQVTDLETMAGVYRGAEESAKSIADSLPASTL